MGVRSSLPVPDVTFILGNDLAGSSLWSYASVSPEVVSVPLIVSADDCALKYPDVFTACAVTRSMAKSVDRFVSDKVDFPFPFPRSKSGYKYLLTIMCATTRFPEAVPLRSVTARAITKALIKLFLVFGLPNMIQSDQGTNFMSRTFFSQVLKRLGIKHNVSTAYHPESQGALERFHQTLKSMLRSYCFELERDWEEGILWLLFASREVVQESLGFSPVELVFGHNPSGPLTILKEKWLSDPKSSTLPEYVSQFYARLYE